MIFLHGKFRKLKGEKSMMTRKDVKSVSENSDLNTDVQTIPATDLIEEVRTLAYALYEQRGRQDGFAEQDWLQAETEILGSHRAFKAAA
jgi:hypothetical protein